MIFRNLTFNIIEKNPQNKKTPEKGMIYLSSPPSGVIISFKAKAPLSVTDGDHG